VGVTSSSNVTDLGMTRLLAGPCVNTLRRVKLRGTRVRASGLRQLFRLCLHLKGVRHNTKDVLHALSGFLKEDKVRQDGSLLSLSFIDFSSCFTIFSPRLSLLPSLVEVRVGADVSPPPQISVHQTLWRGSRPQGRVSDVSPTAGCPLQPQSSHS